MKKNILWLCLWLLIPVSSSAAMVRLPDGDYKKLYAQAEGYFINENYTAALPIYMKLDSASAGNANIKFKIGFCYLNSPTYKTKAIPYLEEAQKNVARKYQEGEINEKQAPLSTSYYLAKAYHLNYEFDKAIEMYEKYKSVLGPDDPKMAEEIADVSHDIETCNFGRELIKNPKKVTVKNLGPGINTQYPEYAPVASLDEQTLIFTTRREGETSKTKLPNGQYFEDIYVSNFTDDQWSAAVPIGKNINSKGHEATVNLSADGQKLLIFKEEGGGNIYVSELKGSEWGAPEMVPAPINTGSWEPHACFSADNRILYFVSDRPGGLGGRDIYKCLRLPGGDWGPAQNLGPAINTKYDEDGVFIHPDGRQIFFSSKGHNSMGGFDIFTSIIDDENGYWSTPLNYGYPVNTTDDDVFLITTADGRRSFFSSDKEGGYGEKDIYMISFPENEPRDITILVGKLVNTSGEDISNNKIYIIDTKKGDTVQVLTANSSSGKFGTNLPVGGTYKTVYTMNDKEFFTETLEVPTGNKYQVVRRDVEYKGDGSKNSSASSDALCSGGKTSYELFFKYNKKEIDPSNDIYKTYVTNLSECLKADPEMVIEMESSASHVPTRSYSSNNELAELRAKAAEKQLLSSLLKQGLKKEQIKFGKANSLVQGPEFNNDAVENKAAYEQFQYIRIKVVKK